MYRCLPPIHCVFVGVLAIPLALVRDSVRVRTLPTPRRPTTDHLLGSFQNTGNLQACRNTSSLRGSTSHLLNSNRLQARTGSIEVGTAQSVRGYSLRESRGG